LCKIASQSGVKKAATEATSKENITWRMGATREGKMTPLETREKMVNAL
jgi:hypothetical protein